MENQLFDIGMIGLGVMGRNLLLNMADQDFKIHLIQAQRDYFGAHTYQRIDELETFFHTEWLGSKVNN